MLKAMHKNSQSKKQDGIEALNLGSRAVFEDQQFTPNTLHKIRNRKNFPTTDWDKKTFNDERYTLAANGELIKNLLQMFKEVMPRSSQLQHGTLRTVHSIGTIQVTIPDVEFKHPNFGIVMISLRKSAPGVLLFVLVGLLFAFPFFATP